jgi:hypothetical protein
MSPQPNRGAHSATGRKQHPLLWLPLLALFLLVATVVAIALLIANLG